MLDLRHKLDYFHMAGWEEEWVEVACEIVSEEFDQGYAGICLESDDEEITLVCNCFFISIISD